MGVNAYHGGVMLCMTLHGKYLFGDNGIALNSALSGLKLCDLEENY